MSDIFDVFRNRIINADTEEVEDLIRQFKSSRANGEISEKEEADLEDIANRKLETGDEDTSN
ncbi:MAG: hypothetical protein R6U02_00950 [Alkalibacterium sp.]|uniref:hypothetical protein n=1 Tax=Alkalibacterium sp. TaxID=1872447 RepID=UPI00397062F9